MKIGIFGAGYVGLCTAACLGQKYRVTLIDIDPKKLDAIKNHRSLIFEKDLDNLLLLASEKGNLHIKSINESFKPFDIIFISVGTPSDSDGYINLQFVRDVSKTLLIRKKEFLLPNHGTLIVMRSTVIPGTTNRMLKRFEKQELAKIAFNPEFLSQGSAIFDTLHPRRIVIGVNQQSSYEELYNLYNEFYENSQIPFISMSIESAEFTKYVSNALLATKISFVNEIADLVQHVENAKIDNIIEGVGLDPRISPHFLRPGIGFGGSCFPKDILALIRFSENLTAETPQILSTVLKVNENRPYRLIKLLREELGDLNDSNIAVLGLAFKPGTNDVRQAPSIKIIQALWRAGAQIRVHDPLIHRIDLKNFTKFNVIINNSIEDCVRKADACLLLTEWPEYYNLELSQLTKEMKKKIIIDGRRIFEKRFIPSDIKYYAIGSFKQHKNF